VDDVEQLTYEDYNFDLVYCSYTTWFISDLERAVLEMCHVTKPNGYLLFDIMNINNLDIRKIYKKHIFENTNLIEKIFKTIKNITKLILQIGSQSWPFVVFQTSSVLDTVIQNCLKYGGHSV